MFVPYEVFVPLNQAADGPWSCSNREEVLTRRRLPTFTSAKMHPPSACGRASLTPSAPFAESETASRHRLPKQAGSDGSRARGHRAVGLCSDLTPGIITTVRAWIRPSLDQNAGALAAVNALTKNNLFAGQSNAFFAAVTNLATIADAAMRGEINDEHDHRHDHDERD
jgi:hypothetical protein